MTADAAVSVNRERIAILWICLILFFLRVIGQVEVWLITPAWLPPMEFWYSGLVAYPLLLPAQIVLLMAMAVIVIDETRGTSSRSERTLRAMRAVALLYFGSMLLRLIVQLVSGASDVLAAGGIPIAFHWVLALFLYELGRSRYVPTAARCPSSTAALTGENVMETQELHRGRLIDVRLEHSGPSTSDDGRLCNGRPRLSC